MGILDIFKKPDKTEILTTHGVSWTNLQSGIISEEYNTDLQFPKSVEIYDEMRKSDGTVIAILRAMKSPLISAKWQIQSGWEEAIDKEIADFITHNLFEKIKFKHFLRESLGFLDFGFYYFEKCFEIVDGKIEWKDFAPRTPRSHYLWSMQSLKDNTWIDWHPQGITQQVNSTDEGSSSMTREIPWNKLILFSFEREGNNFEWTSILRNAYKHYYYKDLLYKVSSISAERYGVGIPVASVKSSMNEKNKEKLVEFLKNIRSNEQSYGVYTDDASDLRIMTPEGSGIGTDIQESIKHHDRKIYDSILAGFLNLTTGEGGSNALSKDQSSFFLRGLQWIADFFIETMNAHIKELVDYNYNGVEKYPTLTVADIGSISMDEQINSIISMNEAGLIDITQDDRQMMRDILKMPRLTAQQMKDIEAEKASQAAIDAKAAKDQLKQQQDLLKWVDLKKKIDKKLAEASGPTSRENAFTKNITEFENFLDKKYEEAVKICEQAEKEWKDVLIELYDNSDSERIDGVVCLKYDKTKITAGKNKIQKITDRLEKQLIDSDLQNAIFDEAQSKAIATLDKNDTYLAKRVIITWQWQINTFIDGYKSNMQWVLYNESRRVLENITLNYGSEASVDLAKKTASSISINRNILSLSFITHPRALYKYIIYTEAQAEWFTMFKTVVPTNLLQNVIDRPFGMTASIIYTIQTAAQINKAANIDTKWKTAEAVTGLWLHHGSFEYYYPIASTDLPIEQAIADAQRIELQAEIDKAENNNQ